VITNTTANAIPVFGRCSPVVNPWLQIGLSNDRLTYQGSPILTVLCPAEKLPPGDTTMAISIRTTTDVYGGCANAVCTEFSTAPLPAGTYRTTLYSLLPDGTALPPSIDITLTD
jgi:hypothetical protein